MSTDTSSSGEVPQESNDPTNEEMLRLVQDALKNPPPKTIANGSSGIDIRQFSDRIFGTVNSTALEAERGELHGREIVVSVPIDSDDEGPLRIDEEVVRIPASALVAVVTGAEVAHRWKKYGNAAERDAFRMETSGRLIKDIGAVNCDAEALFRNPVYRAVVAEMLEDELDGVDTASLIKNGLPPSVLQSEGIFTVEGFRDHDQQIIEIALSTLRRLERLCGNDKKEVMTELAGWERWKGKLRVPHMEDLSTLEAIYKDVRIPYEWFMDLVSEHGEVRAAALENIRKYGGFIHPPHLDDFRETMEHGVIKMTDDGSAYYGMQIDPDYVKKHLKQMCGFDPDKIYRCPEDLPTVSADGWVTEWQADPRSALGMFQSPHQVALSMEVAVMRDKRPLPGNGRGRRNAGAAGALKHDAYTDPRVNQAWVLTRHFQIVEVGIPEMGKPRQHVSGAINVGSDVLIRTLAGREIGSSTEKATIMVPDSSGREHPVEITIRWIWCLAPRKQSIETIEARGHRM